MLKVFRNFSKTLKFVHAIGGATHTIGGATSTVMEINPIIHQSLTLSEWESDFGKNNNYKMIIIEAMND